MWIDTKALFMTQSSEQADRLGLLEDKTPEDIGEWTNVSFRFDELTDFHQYYEYTTVRFADGTTQIIEMSYDQLIELRNYYIESMMESEENLN